ncbi:hypothetical protein [Staphylococcus sp. 191]|uniref:hypothetical protein n=1 Tax=Staphylococcus sp. 191 TaxID=2070016 RepID=UPI001F60EEF9|nr:hypothetical protein [Staphylococcus sp. 191]
MAIFKYIEKKDMKVNILFYENTVKIKNKIRLKKATIRVETNSGIAAQVDWKEDMIMHDKLGRTYQFNIFLYVLYIQ